MRRFVMWSLLGSLGCQPVPQQVASEQDTSAGAVVYSKACASCHQPDGQGLAGVFPPLVGSPWVLTDPGIPIRVVLHGLRGPITVRAETYNGQMLAHKAVLTDQQIADVLTWIRSAWGNQASPITAEQVAAVRAAEAERKTPWTAAELKPR